MPKNPLNSQSLQNLGGWCGILAGSLMVIVLVVLGTTLSPSNMGPDFVKRMQFFSDHRMAYRFCWSMMIVLSFSLLPFVFALYDGLRGRGETSVLIGAVSGALGLIFTAVVGMIRASNSSSIAANYTPLKGHVALKNVLSLEFFFTDKFALNVDTYIVTGFLVVASFLFARAAASVPRYPRTITYGLSLAAILGFVGFAVELLAYSPKMFDLIHIRQYDYNVFICAASLLFPLLAAAMGARLVSGKPS